MGSISYFDKYDSVLASIEELRDRANRNRNTEEGDGYSGRGCVHLTWKNNYLKATKKFGVDFVSNPDLAEEFKYSVPIMIWGMTKGIFSGKKLGDYIKSGSIDYEGARMIINGSDKKSLIADYAKKFEAILRESSTITESF